MTPKCRILCPTFGGHINPSKSYGYFSVTNGSRPTGSNLCVFTIPHFRGFVNRLPPTRRDFLYARRDSGRYRANAVQPAFGGSPPDWQGGASITCKSPRRRSLKDSLGGDLLCLKSPAAAIGLAARSVSGHRRCLSGFPADALPFCAAVPGAPAVGDPVPAEGH